LLAPSGSEASFSDELMIGLLSLIKISPLRKLYLHATLAHIPHIFDIFAKMNTE
jgi:hypothetical protein